MESTIKKRSLRLENVFTPDRIVVASSSLKEIEGIIGVTSKSVDKLTIEYDLMKVNLVKIEKMLEGLEISLSKSLPQKLKRGWINFIEENEAQNMRSIPPDCCSPPK